MSDNTPINPEGAAIDGTSTLLVLAIQPAPAQAIQMIGALRWQEEL